MTIRPITLLGHHRWAIAALMAVIGLMVAGAASQATARPVIPNSEPWPPFVLVYRVTQTPLDENALATGAPVSALYRLTYTDRRHWQATVLESTNPADAVGSTWTFDGDKMTSFNARFGTQRETLYGPDQQPLMDEWLGPDRLAMLTKKPNSTGIISLGNGQAMLVQEETGQTADQKPVQWRRTITHRTADGIPTLMVETIDGREIRRWEVQELTVGSR